MKTQKLSVLFVIKLNKKNQKGVCPLNVRITFNKKRKEFSTGLFVNPAHWNAKKQVVLSKDSNSDFLNPRLDIIQQKINKAYLSLQLKETDFTLDDIYNSYLGKAIKKEDTVVHFFHSYLLHLSKLIGKDIKEVTYKKFKYLCNDVEAFIRHKYHKKDIPLKNLKQHFLNDFEYYLKTVKGQKQITINKSIQRFKKPIKMAVAHGYLDKDPFLLHKSKPVKTEVIFLSHDELEMLEKHEFLQERLQFIKDLFIFSCYTGLAYQELKNLKKEHIVLGFDKQLWIQMKREKTQKDISIPILPMPKKIIEKYKRVNAEEVFPAISNQRYNSYLKEVAAIVGIPKRLTTHTARKTFASTILLYNDVPMEIVSELLGHSSITITEESYGKVVQKKVSEAIIKLNVKLNFD